MTEEELEYVQDIPIDAVKVLSPKLGNSTTVMDTWDTRLCNHTRRLVEQNRDGSRMTPRGIESFPFTEVFLWPTLKVDKRKQDAYRQNYLF